MRIKAIEGARKEVVHYMTSLILATWFDQIFFIILFNMDGIQVILLQYYVTKKLSVGIQVSDFGSGFLILYA